jgi:hypothetical protein
MFYCKKIVASPKNSKWRHFSRWRRKCSYLSPNIFKNDIFVGFSMVFFNILGKNKIFMEKLFLGNSKWQNNII